VSNINIIIRMNIIKDEDYLSKYIQSTLLKLTYEGYYEEECSTGRY
jgi:hypothetical protein